MAVVEVPSSGGGRTHLTSGYFMILIGVRFDPPRSICRKCATFAASGRSRRRSSLWAQKSSPRSRLSRNVNACDAGGWPLTARVQTTGIDD